MSMRWFVLAALLASAVLAESEGDLNSFFDEDLSEDLETESCSQFAALTDLSYPKNWQQVGLTLGRPDAVQWLGIKPGMGPCEKKKAVEAALGKFDSIEAKKRAKARQLMRSLLRKEVAKRKAGKCGLDKKMRNKVRSIVRRALKKNRAVMRNNQKRFHRGIPPRRPGNPFPMVRRLIKKENIKCRIRTAREKAEAKRRAIVAARRRRRLAALAAKRRRMAALAAKRRREAAKRRAAAKARAARLKRLAQQREAVRRRKERRRKELARRRRLAAIARRKAAAELKRRVAAAKKRAEKLRLLRAARAAAAKRAAAARAAAARRRAARIAAAKRAAARRAALAAKRRREAARRKAAALAAKRAAAAAARRRALAKKRAAELARKRAAALAKKRAAEKERRRLAAIDARDSWYHFEMPAHKPMDAKHWHKLTHIINSGGDLKITQMGHKAVFKVERVIQNCNHAHQICIYTSRMDANGQHTTFGVYAGRTTKTGRWWLGTSINARGLRNYAGGTSGNKGSGWDDFVILARRGSWRRVGTYAGAGMGPLAFSLVRRLSYKGANFKATLWNGGYRTMFEVVRVIPDCGGRCIWMYLRREHSNGGYAQFGFRLNPIHQGGWARNGRYWIGYPNNIRRNIRGFFSGTSGNFGSGNMKFTLYADKPGFVLGSYGANRMMPTAHALRLNRQANRGADFKLEYPGRNTGILKVRRIIPRCSFRLSACLYTLRAWRNGVATLGLGVGAHNNSGRRNRWWMGTPVNANSLAAWSHGTHGNLGAGYMPARIIVRPEGWKWLGTWQAGRGAGMRMLKKVRKLAQCGVDFKLKLDHRSLSHRTVFEVSRAIPAGNHVHFYLRHEHSSNRGIATLGVTFSALNGHMGRYWIGKGAHNLRNMHTFFSGTGGHYRSGHARLVLYANGKCGKAGEAARKAHHKRWVARHKTLGRRLNPATGGCKQILRHNPKAANGKYWLRLSSGALVKTDCDMKRGGFTKVSGFRLKASCTFSSGARSRNSVLHAQAGCSKFSDKDINALAGSKIFYSKINGRVTLFTKYTGYISATRDRTPGRVVNSESLHKIKRLRATHHIGYGAWCYFHQNDWYQHDECSGSRPGTPRLSLEYIGCAHRNTRHRKYFCTSHSCGRTKCRGSDGQFIGIYIL